MAQDRRKSARRSVGTEVILSHELQTCLIPYLVQDAGEEDVRNARLVSRYWHARVDEGGRARGCMPRDPAALTARLHAPRSRARPGVLTRARPSPLADVTSVRMRLCSDKLVADWQHLSLLPQRLPALRHLHVDVSTRMGVPWVKPGRLAAVLPKLLVLPQLETLHLTVMAPR
jgi:hypothetical protein